MHILASTIHVLHHHSNNNDEQRTYHCDFELSLGQASQLMLMLDISLSTDEPFHHANHYTEMTWHAEADNLTTIFSAMEIINQYWR